MAKCRHFFAVIGILIAAESGKVNSHNWYNTYRHFPQQPYPNQHHRQNNVEFVQGTIDQLNQIDAKWVCTNIKTGDQMIFGTEIENEKMVNNNAILDQLKAGGYSPMLHNVQQTAIPVVGNTEASRSPRPLTVEQVRKKFANWDWSQYITIQPATGVANDLTGALAFGPSSTGTPAPQGTIEYDGQGILEPRFGA